MPVPACLGDECDTVWTVLYMALPSVVMFIIIWIGSVLKWKVFTE
jgi:hypothetical protein